VTSAGFASICLERSATVIPNEKLRYLERSCAWICEAEMRAAAIMREGTTRRRIIVIT